MWHVESICISVTDTIPHVAYYEKRRFDKLDDCLDFIQGEVNRLCNECGYTRIPSNNSYNQKLGRNFFNGSLQDFVEFQII